MTRIIHDRFCAEYQIIDYIATSGDVTGHDIYQGKRRIGYTRWKFEGDTLALTDLCLEEASIRPPAYYRDIGMFSFSFPPQWWRKINRDDFRNRGIGTQLIALLIAYARSNGVKRIVGRLVDSDCNKHPDLPQWYRNRGFTVTLDNALGKPRAIQMDL